MPDEVGGSRVKQLADRLRAALALPGAKAMLLALLLLLLAAGMRGGTETSLETRIARTLSAMEGAGEVSVVIRTRGGTDGGSGSLLRTDNASEAVPCGAVAVAQGADDPLVRMQLTQALCALLGLQASAVSVVSASGGGL